MISKAGMLGSLYGKLQFSKIEKMMVVTGEDAFLSADDMASHIAEYFGGDKIVVRSSSSNEDGSMASNAGHYESVLNVDSSDADAVVDAVRRVLDSYRVDLDDVDGEQVLIQTQTENISYSGVAFSRELKKDRPYYTISYDVSSTDAVTSGSGGTTVYILRNAQTEELPAHWAALITSMRELEQFLPDYPLDVEFAIDEKCVVTIFQVRPLAASIKGVRSAIPDDKVFEAADDAMAEYDALCDKLGEKNTILSDMAFWNPAEIIGINPHPLDFSLYREIITSGAWNQGLSYIGYKYVDGDLMYKIGNKPYISLKKSFLGLMPDDIDNRLEQKLLRYYNRKLLSDPTAHDKIEFEIAFSDYDFSTEDKLSELSNDEFNGEEIRDISDCLFDLTNNAICNFKINRMKDLRALNGLRVHRENIRNNWIMADNDVATLIQYFVQLIESIKHYGTPKFARQARLAFISKAICRSLVYKGYFTHKEIDDFMMSIYTVASEYDSDFQDLVDGRITRVTFDEKYGHLRSGTYDITCENYAQRTFDLSKGSDTARKQRQKIEELKHNPLDSGRLLDALEEIGFFVNLRDFLDFLKDSMEEREYFKFEFTKSLSLAIDILIEIGEKLGFEKDDMAYLEAVDIQLAAGMDPDMIKKRWKTVIFENREKYKVCSMLILPDVIYDRNQVKCIEIWEARPNFITSECVCGEVVLLENYENEDHEDIADVSGRIVVIPKADPGYDWIFAKGIKGFITKYGGVASHMAIRCAEFNIPAAIGCGDCIYSFVEKQKAVTLDCENGKITACEENYGNSEHLGLSEISEREV